MNQAFFVVVAGIIVLVLCTVLFLNNPVLVDKTNTTPNTDRNSSIIPHSEGKWQVVSGGYGDNDPCLKDLLNRLYPHKDLTYICADDVETVTDKTLAVYFNTEMPDFGNIPASAITGMSWEPRYYMRPLNSTFMNYVSQRSSEYLVGDKRDIDHDKFKEHYTFLPFLRPSGQLIPKTKVLSIMVSDKKEAPGHQYRYELCHQLIAHNIPVDIYGRGASHFQNKVYGNSRVVGEFQEDELYADYMFTIAIENFVEPHYFSEKVTSPIMYNTTPLYLGCPNIETYLSDKCVIRLNGQVSHDIHVIQSVVQHPELHRLDLNKAQQSLEQGRGNLTHYLLRKYKSK